MTAQNLKDWEELKKSIKDTPITQKVSRQLGAFFLFSIISLFEKAWEGIEILDKLIAYYRQLVTEPILSFFELFGLTYPYYVVDYYIFILMLIRVSQRVVYLDPNKKRNTLLPTWQSMILLIFMTMVIGVISIDLENGLNTGHYIVGMIVLIMLLEVSFDAMRGNIQEDIKNLFFSWRPILIAVGIVICLALVKAIFS